MEIKEQSRTGMNASEKDNASYGEHTVLNKQIEGTPFTARWEIDKGWSWGMAGFKISEWLTSEEEMLEDVKNITWDKIIGVLTIVIDATEKMKEIVNNGNNE